MTAEQGARAFAATERSGMSMQHLIRVGDHLLARLG
jgi:hypothetical protein